MNSITFFFKIFFLISILLTVNAFSKTINKIEVLGNDRISDETIKLFISVNINDDINDDKLNKILKDLYETNFFENVSLKLDNQILFISVLENPIIEDIIYNGVKSNRILDIIKKETNVKSRSSYNENIIKKEKIKI
ncbi:outer membrane protein assembly factor BamA, partial [Candidatus Pelagibacter sp.]|nr:outer membrane protein assembly factor BamA [Candidatus Pelagibacter sp.]